MYILTNQFLMDLQCIAFDLIGKDLADVRLKKAKKWLDKNSEIVEYAGIKMLVCHKIPEDFFLYSTVGCANFYFYHADQPILDALKEKLESENIPICIYKTKESTTVKGVKELCERERIDFNRVDQSVMKQQPFPDEAVFYNDIPDEEILYWIKQSRERKCLGNPHPREDMKKTSVFRRLYERFYDWLHEIDYKNARAWAEKHGKFIELEDIGIKIFYLLDDMPRYVGKYCDMRSLADVVYLNSNSVRLSQIFADNYKLDLRNVGNQYRWLGYCWSDFGLILPALHEGGT